eukprot:m.135730 g.135730  ORF g.135730 m.135730 type:complete len:606 (+) comp20173_c0_seq2:153-1970(+)
MFLVVQANAGCPKYYFSLKSVQATDFLPALLNEAAKVQAAERALAQESSPTDDHPTAAAETVFQHAKAVLSEHFASPVWPVAAISMFLLLPQHGTSIVKTNEWMATRSSYYPRFAVGSALQNQDWKAILGETFAPNPTEHHKDEPKSRKKRTVKPAERSAFQAVLKLFDHTKTNAPKVKGKWTLRSEGRKYDYRLPFEVEDWGRVSTFDIPQKLERLPRSTCSGVCFPPKDSNDDSSSDEDDGHHDDVKLDVVPLFRGAYAVVSTQGKKNLRHCVLSPDVWEDPEYKSEPLAAPWDGINADSIPLFHERIFAYLREKDLVASHEKKETGPLVPVNAKFMPVLKLAAKRATASNCPELVQVLKISKGENDALGRIGAFPEQPYSKRQAALCNMEEVATRGGSVAMRATFASSADWETVCQSPETLQLLVAFLDFAMRCQHNPLMIDTSKLYELVYDAPVRDIVPGVVSESRVSHAVWHLPTFDEDQARGNALARDIYGATRHAQMELYGTTHDFFLLFTTRGSKTPLNLGSVLDQHVVEKGAKGVWDWFAREVADGRWLEEKEGYRSQRPMMVLVCWDSLWFERACSLVERVAAHRHAFMERIFFG